MPLPSLYEQNLVLNSGDRLSLNTYKLGLIEALLKESIKVLDREPGPPGVQERLRTALDVALWEPPRHPEG